VDGRVAGFYTLVPAPRDWELDNLWVHPRWMAQGIGRALLRHALEAARSGGASRVRVDSDPNAEPFYLACGALRTGSVPAPIPGDPGRARPQLEFDLSGNAYFSGVGKTRSKDPPKPQS
jgi:GNAT superfamily N-acetyltransferase